MRGSALSHSLLFVFMLSSPSAWAFEPRLAPSIVGDYEARSTMTGGLEGTEMPQGIEQASRETAPVSSLTRNGSVRHVAVIAGEIAFIPSVIRLVTGIRTELSLTSTGAQPLCFISDDFNIRKQVSKGKLIQLELTPQKSGSYRFYCPINGAEGTLIVTDSITSGQAERVPGNDPEVGALGVDGRSELHADPGPAPVDQKPSILAIQTGASAPVYWRVWEIGQYSHLPTWITTSTQLSFLFSEVFQPYAVFEKSLVPSDLEFMLVGGGAKIPFFDPVESLGLSGSFLSSAKLYAALDFVYYIVPPQPPAATAFLSDQDLLRVGGGMKWAFGRKRNIFLDTSVMLFKPNNSWYINPLVAFGLQF